MATAHLIYGLSFAREQFVQLVNGNPQQHWVGLGFGPDDLPVFTDQLVPNSSEDTPHERARKLDIMMQVTHAWGNDQVRRALLQQLQATLTDQLRASAQPDYIPTADPFQRWETTRLVRKALVGMPLKQNDFFARKCKTGLRMQSPKLGRTVFVVNGLDMVKIVTKALDTRSIITFRELRAVYRMVKRNQGPAPHFVRVVCSADGTPVSLARTPEPWSNDWHEFLTVAQARALALNPPNGMPASVAEKFFACRGSDLWSRYRIPFVQKAKDRYVETGAHLVPDMMDVDD